MLAKIELKDGEETIPFETSETWSPFAFELAVLRNTDEVIVRQIHAIKNRKIEPLERYDQGQYKTSSTTVGAGVYLKSDGTFVKDHPNGHFFRKEDAYPYTRGTHSKKNSITSLSTSKMTTSISSEKSYTTLIGTST